MHDCAYGEGITPANPRGTDVWKSWVQLRCTRPDLKMNVINIDWGVGVIPRGNQDIWDEQPLEVCLTEEYFTSLVDNNSHNPLDSYNLSSNGQFLTDDSCVYSVDDNLTTKFMSLLSMLPFFPLYYGGNTKFTPIQEKHIGITHNVKNISNPNNDINKI